MKNRVKERFLIITATRLSFFNLEDYSIESTKVIPLSELLDYIEPPHPETSVELNFITHRPLIVIVPKRSQFTDCLKNQLKIVERKKLDQKERSVSLLEEV